MSMNIDKSLEDRAINTLRFLSVDAIQKANSGHPGLPLGTAAIAYTIWTKHLNHNPEHPQWFNRDRFVLSGGHGSALLYSLLYLTGYDLFLVDLMNFRQWGSITPGHPEYAVTSGVEVTTGPLGQGFANGVGMAIAHEHLAARFNTPEHKLVDHYIYGIVTDGDLMEGVASEAASLAGHLKLGRIVYFYDDNRISIDGSTDIAFTEDRAARFRAYGWHVQLVEDGNDVEALDQAVIAAKADPRPSLIVARTTIGYGLPTRAGTPKAHGEPPGAEEIRAAKEAVGWPADKDFHVPDEVLKFYRQALEQGTEKEQNWNKSLGEYCQKNSELGEDLARVLACGLPVDWDKDIPVFETDKKGIATRASSGKVLNAIAPNLKDLTGGSADLAPSNKTWINGEADFQSETPEGRNFHFGVREHAMGAVVNGMSLYPGVIPYGGTFLVFSDYMRGSVRLSALSEYPSIWIFTHDSIGVGEDGPTHQPVEHLTSLRIIPGLSVIRPGDANETAEAWKLAIENRDQPTALVLSRQNARTLDRDKYAPASGLTKGAYVLADLGGGPPELIMMATGTELQYIVEAGEVLAEKGIKVRLVSFPSWDLFEAQTQEYKDSVLLPAVSVRISVEAGITLGWEKYVGSEGVIIGHDGYGASAPQSVVYEKFGFTAENVILKALELIG
jgi:transketolase